MASTGLKCNETTSSTAKAAAEDTQANGEEDEERKHSVEIETIDAPVVTLEPFDEDDQQFEVDDAVCTDGKKYDLKFDPQMKLKRKNVD